MLDYNNIYIYEIKIILKNVVGVQKYQLVHSCMSDVIIGVIS